MYFIKFSVAGFSMRKKIAIPQIQLRSFFHCMLDPPIKHLVKSPPPCTVHCHFSFTFAQHTNVALVGAECGVNVMKAVAGKTYMKGIWSYPPLCVIPVIYPPLYVIPVIYPPVCVIPVTYPPVGVIPVTYPLWVSYQLLTPRWVSYQLFTLCVCHTSYLQPCGCHASYLPSCGCHTNYLHLVGVIPVT